MNEVESLIDINFLEDEGYVNETQTCIDYFYLEY